MNIIKLNISNLSFQHNQVKPKNIHIFKATYYLFIGQERKYWILIKYIFSHPYCPLLLVLSTLPRHFVGLHNSACSNRQDSWLLSNRRSRSRFDYQKEERRKKKEETRIIYFVAIKKSRTVHSAPIPSSWKRIIYLVAIKKPKTGSIFCPNSPQNWLLIIVGIIQITELKQTLRTLFVVTSPPVIINQES